MAIGTGYQPTTIAVPRHNTIRNIIMMNWCDPKGRDNTNGSKVGWNGTTTRTPAMMTIKATSSSAKGCDHFGMLKFLLALFILICNEGLMYSSICSMILSLPTAPLTPPPPPTTTVIDTSTTTAMPITSHSITTTSTNSSRISNSSSSSNIGNMTTNRRDTTTRLRTEPQQEQPTPIDFDGVTARAFAVWPANLRLPCFPAESSWYHSQTLRTPSRHGFLFAKPMKTGGSTAVGVHVRLARNVAQRLHHNPNTPPFASTGRRRVMCKTRHDHTAANQLGYGTRDRQQSFLWTVLRDPTKRAISQFFHFEVSRKKVEPTDANFREWITSPPYDTSRYYLRALTTNSTYNGDDEIATANQILQDYDFIAITERMDESIVALQLILNLTTADVLHLNAKSQGGFDDGGDTDVGCVRVQPSFVSPGMQEYFDTSDEWKNLTYADTLLHRAANRSLDLTIEQTIGRDRFAAALDKFRKAQQEVQEKCAKKAIFPCSPGGVYQPLVSYTDCLWYDSGCGTECIDGLVSENPEWNQYSSL